MIIHFLTLPLAVLVGLGSLRFLWPRADTEAKRTRLAGIAAFLALVLLASALVAFVKSHRAQGWIEAREVRQVAALRGVPEDQKVLLIGHVSDQNGVVSRDAVALIDCEKSCEERLPDDFKVELADGTALVDDDDYEPVAWRTEIYGGHTTSFLRRQDAIVVVGEAAGSAPKLSDADLLYSGSIDAFRAYASREHAIALTLLVLDLVLATLLVGGAVTAYVKRKVPVAPAAPTETPLVPPAA